MSNSLFIKTVYISILLILISSLQNLYSQAASATCSGATENNFRIEITGLNAALTYDITIDGTLVGDDITGTSTFTSADIAFNDGTDFSTVLIDEGANGSTDFTITVHELLCTDADNDGDIDQNEASCDYTKALPNIGTIVSQVAPHNTENVYLYVLTDDSGIVVSPVQTNNSGLFEDLPEGDYKVYAFNFLDVTDANTFAGSLSGGDDLNGSTNSTNPCYSFCGASMTYTISCPCLINIDTDPVDITLCEADSGMVSIVTSINSPVPSGASLEYQWERNTGSGFSSFSDTDSILNIPPVTNAMDGDEYRVIITLDVNSTNVCRDTSATITLTVNAKPILSSNLDATVCSDIASGITLSTSGGGTIDDYDIPSTNVAADLSGTATEGFGLAANAIVGDVFTNTTGGPLTVTYRVVPISTDGCAGDTVNVVLTVDPEPILANNLDATVCSDIASGITLSTSGDTPASSYNIPTSTVASGLSGTATDGTGLSANAIVGDVFTNTTSGPLTVTYRVVPISTDGCAGDTVNVVLTVDPEPILANNLDATVCSDIASGITLSTSGDTPASSYNIPTSTVASGLSGTATDGTGLAANAIVGDVFTNTTSGPLTVTYRVVPISAAGCAGDTVDVVLTVNPEPILANNLDATVCSDIASGITLSTSGDTPATSYNIPSSTVASGLTGTASDGPGLMANAIVGDVFTNTTSGPLTVTYRVVPISAAGCAGDTVDVVLTVDPKAVVEAGSSPPICSNGTVDLTSIGASITGGTTTGQWSTSTGGTFNNSGVFGGGTPSTTFTPSTTDVTNGTVTLTLTSDDPTGACSQVSDSITITINSVTCGTFPWGGN